jgi:hypothetical protein
VTKNSSMYHPAEHLQRAQIRHYWSMKKEQPKYHQQQGDSTIIGGCGWCMLCCYHSRSACLHPHISRGFRHLDMSRSSRLGVSKLHCPWKTTALNTLIAPAAKAVEYERVKFNNTMGTGSPYVGFGPEVDRAWRAISYDGNFFHFIIFIAVHSNLIKLAIK